MILKTHPPPGTIVRVDLSQGFAPPEMVKRRPAIILSPPIPKRMSLCSIVPLSTSDPAPVLPHHLQLAFNPPLPKPYDSPTMWLKGDFVLTISFRRLSLLFSRRQDGQRVYDARQLGEEEMNRVRACVRAGLGL